MKRRKEIVVATGLAKWYGQIIGLNDFNITIYSGITGIVGPNGAGKSTFFKVLTGLVRPSAGTIGVLGMNPWNNPEIHRKIGFCPDYNNLPPDMTGREFLDLMLRMKTSLTRQSRDERIMELYEKLEMKDYIDRRIGTYSMGMKQRLKIANALSHDPELLVLDEPLSGTDPIVRREIIDFIKNLSKKEGYDVIVSSHILPEIEAFTKDIAVIFRGRVIARGTVEHIRSLIDSHPHTIIIEGENLLKLSQELVARDYVSGISFSDDRKSLTVLVKKPEHFYKEIPGIVSGLGARINKMYTADDNLESVYRYLVGGY